MAHIMITLFPCHLQTVQSLLSIERGTEISHCAPIMPQFHGTREAQHPHCGIHASVFHRVSQVVILGAGAKRVQKNGSGRTLCWCRFLQLHVPTTITGYVVNHGQETNPPTRRRICGVWVRSSLSLLMTTARGSRICICGNPPSPIPVHIMVRQSLTSNTALGRWYRPFWRGRIVSSTWAKRKWYVLRAC